MDPHNFFNLLVGNIINRMLFTNRFEKEGEERFFALKKNLDEMAHSFTPFDVFITEWNINWPIVRWRMKHLMKPLDAIKEFIQNQINQRRDSIANGSHVPQGEGEDFVDAFLIQMNKDRQSGVETSFDRSWRSHVFSEETLLMTLLDLWSAGQETTLTALYWVFTFLLLNPQVQKRVEEELFSLTSGQRLISLTDKTKTPYFNAVLTEIFRCALMAPLNLLRQSTEDTMVGPYSIPKGTSITAQVSLIGTDEKHFTNPFVQMLAKRELKSGVQFDPDRYFNNDGLEQMVLPFGLGKRACPGSPLANAELYLIVSNLLLRYKISADPDHMPTLRARSEAGNMRQAQPYHICFEQRLS
ncbi:unnamed protein product [Nippostrongylus brasiliensis]|uniref:Unspecific monooxygenase n=1 Tax=Nippostrongylus brasiliensis TaxID=27835 RepID=A0A0N4YUY5_NIPBR|nr:unnamed protein product [Nippostrongylus brasiliensis]